ncbi:MAG: hypothetical protein M1823_007722, partial [Watsoniomyces obsoletus]
MIPRTTTPLDKARAATSGMSLERGTILILGRPHGLTRRRLEDLVGEAGGRIAARANGQVTHVVLAHGTARLFLHDGTRLKLPRGVPVAAKRLSELAFKRALGLAAAPAPEP